MLNIVMTYCLGCKKIRKILLKINSGYFGKKILHNLKTKTRTSV